MIKLLKSVIEKKTGEIQTKHVEFTPTHHLEVKERIAVARELWTLTRTKSKAVSEKNQNYLYLERKIHRVVLSVPEWF